MTSNAHLTHCHVSSKVLPALEHPVASAKDCTPSSLRALSEPSRAPLCVTCDCCEYEYAISMTAVDNDSRARAADAVIYFLQMDDERIIEAAESLLFQEFDHIKLTNRTQF